MLTIRIFLFFNIVILQSTVLLAGVPHAIDEGTEEFVYIVDEKKSEQNSTSIDESPHENKIKNFFKKHADQLIDQQLDAAGNVLSTGYLSLGLSLSVQKLSRKDVSIDPDKFPSIIPQGESSFNNQWYKYGFSVTPILGSTQLLNLFDGIKLPMQLDPVAGISGGKKVYVTLTTPRNIRENVDYGVTKRVLNYVKGVTQAYKFTLPRKAKHLLNEIKYPSGTEIVWKKQTFGLFGFGLNLPTHFSAGVRKYLLLEGNLTKKFKIYRELGKTFVEVGFYNEKTKSDENALEAKFGVNIFESSSINAGVSIRLLTTSKKKIESKSFKISYVFDLSYEESIKALDEIMKNNYTQAQNYAVDVTQFDLHPSSYKGILLIENHTIDLLSKIFSLHYGLFKNRFGMDLGSFTLSLNNLLPDIFFSSLQKSESVSEGVYSYPYQYPIKRYSFTLNKDKQLKVLGGLWFNRTLGVLYNNELIKTTTLQNDSVTYNQILIQETVSNENKNESHFNKYYEPNRYILKILKPELSAVLFTVEQNNSCYENYKMTKHLILYPSSIKDILNSTKEDHYKTFALLFNIPYASWWRDDKVRKQKLHKHFKNYFKNGENGSDSLYRYMKKMYDLFSVIEKLDLDYKSEKVESKNQFFQVPTDYNFDKSSIEIAKKFHFRYKKVIMTPGFIDYLTLLAHHSNSREYFSGFILKSNKCNIQWINSPQTNINPESISKEIDSYMQDFWE